MFKEAGEDLIHYLYKEDVRERERIWPNQKYHKKDHTLCKLKQARNIMYACVASPKTSHYVMVLMQDQVLVLESLLLPKMDLLHFVDASIVQMQLVNVMEHTAHYRIG